MECLDSVKNASFFTFFKTKSEFVFFGKNFRFCFLTILIVLQISRVSLLQNMLIDVQYTISSL